MVSPYMRASEVLVMVLMLLSAFMACVWIPYNMNEYGMPILFRNSNSNVFLDLLNLRLFAFAYFMSLSGCLAHLQFYKIDPSVPCLHTSSSQVSLTWVDQQQFILCFLVWTITIPAALFIWFGIIRDNIRYVCIPVMISTIVFQVLIFVLSLITIVHCLIAGNHWVIQLAHWVNIIVFSFSTVIAICYRRNFAARDLLKTDEEEI